MIEILVSCLGGVCKYRDKQITYTRLLELVRGAQNLYLLIRISIFNFILVIVMRTQISFYFG